MPMRMMRGTAVLLAAGLAGCASVSNFVGDPWISPGKFQFLRCEDLARRIVTAEDKQRQLRVLMDRANNGAAGTPVNVFVYGPDLQTVEAELRLLRKTSGEKRCADEVVKLKSAQPTKEDVGPLR
jgi:hypothetical protein